MFKVGMSTERMSGMGADEEFGPQPPTVLQKATQVVTDVSNTVESTTGLKNFAYYIGVVLIGYVAYNYIQGE